MDEIIDRIKGIFWWLVIIAIIIIVPVSLFTDFFNLLGNAIKWVFFIDNAETGLPLWGEYLVKGIVEGVIGCVAIALWISEKNPLITIIGIIVGFIVCTILYFIATYFVWILVGICALVVATITFIIIRGKIRKKNLYLSLQKCEE